MNEFPYSYVTQDELSKVPSYVTKPNEFKAMIEWYLGKEKKAAAEYAAVLEGNLTLVDKVVGDFFGTKKFEAFTTAKLRCLKSNDTLLKSARKKDYSAFLGLLKDEVDDLVVMSLAYDYTYEVRKIMDFYDRNKERDNLVYINHYQRRALTWVVTNEKMLASYINDYYKSNAY